jgi:DNA-binding NarL/FixJ family response regulator
MLEKTDGRGAKRVVVTWNSSPEHLEDLYDLQPDALLTDDFFLRHDLANCLEEIFACLQGGKRYRFTPGARTPLTPAERAVLRYVAQGWCNERISTELYIEKQTVKNRLQSVYRKLGVKNRVEATLHYWQLYRV